MRDGVFIVNNPPLLRKMTVRKKREGFIAYLWLPKTNHVNVGPYQTESESCKLSKRSTQTVASHFDLVKWILVLKTLDFRINLVPD